MKIDKMIKNVLKNKQKLNKINFKTEKIAMTRMRKQKNISKFGDFDFDGVPNIFDCDPFDRTKQAEVHNQLKKQPINFKQGITNVGTAAGLFKKETPKQEYIDVGGVFIGPGVEVNKEQLLEAQKRSAILKQQERSPGFFSELQQEGSKQLSGIKKGFTQSSGELIEGFKAASPITEASNIRQRIGVSSGEGFYKALGSEPPQLEPQQIPMDTRIRVSEQPQFQQPQVQQPQVQPSIQQAQRSTEVGVMSPYSKRKVTYVRGPYNKREKIQQ